MKGQPSRAWSRTYSNREWIGYTRKWRKTTTVLLHFFYKWRYQDFVPCFNQSGVQLFASHGIFFFPGKKCWSGWPFPPTILLQCRRWRRHEFNPRVGRFLEQYQDLERLNNFLKVFQQKSWNSNLPFESPNRNKNFLWPCTACLSGALYHQKCGRRSWRCWKGIYICSEGLDEIPPLFDVEFSSNFYWSIVDLQYCVSCKSTASESVIHIHISTLFKIIFPYRQLQSIG